MVKEDERKMDALTQRHTELVTVNNNSHLLAELFNSCVKMQPKLVRLASETEKGKEAIADVLTASDELSKVFDSCSSGLEQLLMISVPET